MEESFFQNRKNGFASQDLLLKWGVFPFIRSLKKFPDTSIFVHSFAEIQNPVIRRKILMKKITIATENLSIQAEIYSTPTAEKIYDALPLESEVNVWGDEIYFDIPLNLELEPGAAADVAVGDLAYWPTGPAFCVFFGPTPVSTDDQPRAYSPVNVFGRVLGDARTLKAVSSGAVIRVTRADLDEE